jgi:hypothetical protein
MDDLDRLIINSHNKIIIESLGIGTGNGFNSIHVDWSLSQDNDLLKNPPFNRVVQWCMHKSLFDANRKLRIDNIPETIDANEVALWLAKELKKEGKIVQLRVWVAPHTFKPVEIN